MPPHTPAAITPNVDAETQLVEYFALLGTLLWDSRQRHSFATYAIGLMSQLERKSLEPIAASSPPTPARELSGCTTACKTWWLMLPGPIMKFAGSPQTMP